MNIKTIKSKICDTEELETRRTFKCQDLIKQKVGINNSALMYFLGYFYFGEVLLCNKKLYVYTSEFEFDSNKKIIVDKTALTELHEITLLKEYPKTASDIECKTIISSDKSKFSIDNFLFWIDEPCNLTENINNPFYEIIKFLNGYTKELFKTDRYLFYSKPDNDYTWILNIYAYDLKNNAEIKLYSTDNWDENSNKYLPPENLQDVVANKLDSNLSVFQLRECKKAFLEFANKVNSTFKGKNYWVIELVKQTIQPVVNYNGWSWHRCFSKPKLFGHIFVQDIPNKDETPSFIVTDEYSTKIAVLEFKNSEYLVQGNFISGCNKAKQWILTENEIRELIEFFNNPSERLGSKYYKGSFDKYVKTNWQQLIFEYNQNTAGWGWGETGFDVPPEKDTDRLSDIEALPFDLPIPNYFELLNKSSNLNI